MSAFMRKNHLLASGFGTRIQTHDNSTHIFQPGITTLTGILRSITIPLLAASTLKDLVKVTKTTTVGTGSITYGFYTQ